MQPTKRASKFTVRPSEPGAGIVREVVSSFVAEEGPLDLVEICGAGDIILDVKFENGKSVARLPPAQIGPSKAALVRNVRSADTRKLYRVRLEKLTTASKYFDRLLGSDTFEEGRRIARIFKDNEIEEEMQRELHPSALPRISITDDDDSTRIAGREIVFGDMLRILHGDNIVARGTLTYLAVLATMADRFGCCTIISKYVKSSKKFPWPQSYGATTSNVEESIRQKILISWLLEDQVKFIAATKELIIKGSTHWTTEDRRSKDQEAIWWDLQDGLEAELLCRRSRIMNTIASVQTHFLALYTSKTRQCKQFYDSSAACDSYSLGEMIKFFVSKGLLTLTSPLSANYDECVEVYNSDVEGLITTLRQCPTYQIDANHAHCGLRSRIIPRLDFIQSMLTSSIGIDRQGWQKDRLATSWESDSGSEPFKYTQALATDSRLKMEGLLIGNKHAKNLFTAPSWDWSPDYNVTETPRLGRAFGSMSGL